MSRASTIFTASAKKRSIRTAAGMIRAQQRAISVPWKARMSTASEAIDEDASMAASPDRKLTWYVPRMLGMACGGLLSCCSHANMTRWFCVVHRARRFAASALR